MKAWSPLSRLASVLLLAALLPACNNSRDNTNPFASASVTVPPPDGAALIFTSSVWALTPGAGREIYSVSVDGSNVTRLTFCNNLSACDYAEAAPAPDRIRVGARRASVDTNGDGEVNEADGTALLFVDLKRGVEALLAPASRLISGVDWAPTTGTFYLYSGLPAGGGAQDLFTMDYNGQNDRNLSCPADSTALCVPTVREVRPRLNPSESAAVFQRIDASGASLIALFQSVSNQPPLTSGPNDADPVFSPDSQHVAFRRRTNATANDGLGSWDIATVGIDGTGYTVIASGPAFRGAPDWGPNGLAWAEVDSASQRLVVTGPNGAGPLTTIVTQPAGATLTNPRWLQRPQ